MYTLRPATDQDFEFVFRLNEANMRPYIERLRGWQEADERCKMKLLFRPHLDRIVLVDGVEAGVLSTVHRGNYIGIRHLEILPSLQRRGIGSALIHAVLEEARGVNVPVVLTVLKGNPAKELYERLGFSIREEVDTGLTGIKYRMST
jgi:GNAT superfamily N-acetyltransferase